MAVNITYWTMDAVRMATTSMVEKFREIQLFPEVSVSESVY